MITAYIGLPGTGKTSILTLIAQQKLKDINRGRSKYNFIASTFPCQGCFQIRFSDLGQFWLHDCLILIDEATLECDSRAWKTFSNDTKSFIVLHRHFGIDIIYTCQDFSRVEKTIRENTYQLNYLTRSRLPFFNRWSRAERIWRTININEYTSELLLGYRFSNRSEIFFGGAVKRWYLPKAWKLFDTFDDFGFSSKPVFPLSLWDSVGGPPASVAQESTTAESLDNFDLDVSAHS